MDLPNIAKKFKEFIEINKDVQDEIYKSKRNVSIDIKQLQQQFPELEEEFDKNPDDFFTVVDSIVSEYSEQKFDKEKKLNVRIKNYNEFPSKKLALSDVRVDHIGKMFWSIGIVKQLSQVRPLVVMSKFTCNGCSNLINVMQFGKRIIKPKRCACGCTSFLLQDQNMEDVQRIILQQDVGDLDSHQQPSTINVILKGGLTNKGIIKYYTAGTKVCITGIIRDIPLGNEDLTTDRDFLLEANYVRVLEKSLEDITINKSHIKEIEEFSKEDIMKKILDKFCINIYGNGMIKKTMILQMFGGVRGKEGSKTERGQINVLLIGDPSTGKSRMAKSVLEFMPKSKYASGKGSSGAGLTATVVKDEFIGGWALEAGAMILANGSLVVLDEFDKLSDEDKTKLHEIMSEQTLTIDKANIHTTLKAETGLLCCANPKQSRFDDFTNISEQVNMPASLITRFDVIFVLRDEVNEERDRAVIRAMLNKKEIDMKFVSFLKRYIIYAKKKNPVMNDNIKVMIEEFYLEKRMGNRGTKLSLTSRYGECLIRLCQASARMRLSETIEREDFELAYEIIIDSLKTVFPDDSSAGTLDIDRIEGESTDRKRKAIHIIKDVVETHQPVHIDILIPNCVDKGVPDSKVEEMIMKLHQEGELIEVKRNTYRLSK